MRVVGVEPTHRKAQDPKSCASANSAIPAYSICKQYNRFIIQKIKAAVNSAGLILYAVTFFILLGISSYFYPYWRLTDIVHLGYNGKRERI